MGCINGVDYENVHIRLEKVAEYWGPLMPIMTIEEMSELTKELSKSERLGFPTHNLVKEMADVYISLYAIMQHYNIDSMEIEDAMNAKLAKNYTGDEFKNFIFDNLGDRATCIWNCLKRNNINTEYHLKKLIDENKDWYKKLRGIGATKARYIEEALAKKYNASNEVV